MIVFDEISLFLGAFLDALIGPNLFVPGEPFLLAAGYQLHQGIWNGVIAVLLGGLLGDQLSYLIGRRFGKPGLRKLTGWQPKIHRPVARCRLLMAKKGNYILAFARLLGPVAWVVPFIAGSNRISWRRFSFYSSFGLFLGIGMFVTWGYLLAYGIDKFPLLNEIEIFIGEHQYSLIAVSVTLLVFYVGFKRKWRFLTATTSAVFLVAMLAANYGHFFWLADDFRSQLATQPEKESFISTDKIDFKAYPGRSAFFDAQAINILYIGDSPRPLMHKLGWIENKTFSRHEIEWDDYIALLKNKTPPVSDLFWNDRPQDMAFQLPGDLMKRSHIRWWSGGIDPQSQQTIWLGAVSYDDGLTLTPYSGILTVLHSVDPNVDSERDKLARQIKKVLPTKTTQLVELKAPVILDEQHDYYTDGKVLMINDLIT